MSAPLDFEVQARWTNIDSLHPLITLSSGSMIITTLLIFWQWYGRRNPENWPNNRAMESWHINRDIEFYLPAFAS
jgi:hypothetical protein